MGQELASVFAVAAVPQKIVFVVLILSLLAALLATASALHGGPHDRNRSRFLSELRVAAPALGLLVAAMNGFHMAQTSLRLPISPTAKMLAPALMEMAALAGLGALVGLVAVALNWAVVKAATASGQPSRSSE